MSRTESDSFEFPKIYKESGVEKSVGGVKYKSKRVCWRQAELWSFLLPLCRRRQR